MLINEQLCDGSISMKQLREDSLSIKQLCEDYKFINEQLCEVNCE